MGHPEAQVIETCCPIGERFGLECCANCDPDGPAEPCEYCKASDYGICADCDLAESFDRWGEDEEPVSLEFELDEESSHV